jgi:hypothetical protein
LLIRQLSKKKGQFVKLKKSAENKKGSPIGEPFLGASIE